jgi:hypothetical protein
MLSSSASLTLPSPFPHLSLTIPQPSLTPQWPDPGAKQPKKNAWDRTAALLQYIYCCGTILAQQSHTDLPASLPAHLPA